MRTPLPSVLSPVIFVPTTRFAVDKSTSDTFGLPILEYKPLFSSNLIAGTPNAKVVVVFVPLGR